MFLFQVIESDRNLSLDIGYFEICLLQYSVSKELDLTDENMIKITRSRMIN